MLLPLSVAAHPAQDSFVIFENCCEGDDGGIRKHTGNLPGAAIVFRPAFVADFGANGNRHGGQQGVCNKRTALGPLAFRLCCNGLVVGKRGVAGQIRIIVQSRTPPRGFTSLRRWRFPPLLGKGHVDVKLCPGRPRDRIFMERPTSRQTPNHGAV